MTSISKIIAEMAAAANVDERGDNSEAHAKLLNGIQRLQLAVEKPIETAKRILYQPPTNAALRVAVEMGLIDAIAARWDDSPITAQQLANQQSTNALLVVRIMRAITAVGICNEVGPSLYSPNQVTREFATLGLSDGVKCLYDCFMPAAASIVKTLDSMDFRSPTEARETSFFHANGATLFEWLKFNPKQRKSFDNYMAFRRKDALPWFKIFPITEQFVAGLRSDPQAVIIVDVGGSQGHDLLKLRQQFPGLSGRMILQDLPETIDALGDALSDIEPMPYNFYSPQPVNGARVYYFGAICHDWPDDYCVKLLSNTVKAMEKDYSVILINDYVVPETGASVRAAAMDIQMMSLSAGMERTENQWVNLLSMSGLSIVRIWYSGTESESIIEAKATH